MSNNPNNTDVEDREWYEFENIKLDYQLKKLEVERSRWRGFVTTITLIGTASAALLALFRIFGVI